MYQYIIYLHVILLIWNILSGTTEALSMNTKENVWCNKNGIKECKKNNHSVVSFVSILWKILVNVLKQFWKCP